MKSTHSPLGHFALKLDALAHMQFLFTERTFLGKHLEACGLLGDVRKTPRDSPLLLLRELLPEFVPPCSARLIVTESSGAAEGKESLLRRSFANELAVAPELAERIWHLMCFAGRDGNGNPVLLNLPKPAFGNRTCTPLLLKTGEGGGEGHLVLNLQIASNQAGGFIPLSEIELAEVTGGMRRHGVNMLLTAADYDRQPGLRCVLCSSFFELYLKTDYATAQFVEIPLGANGDKYSIVIPIEAFLAFMIRFQGSFPHAEIHESGKLSERELRSSMAALRNLLSPESLSTLLKYNERRPVMASFKAFVGQLTTELMQRAPFLDRSTCNTAVTNFVRHFFAVEHGLVVSALAAADPAAEQACFEALCRTEYGRLLLPCDSITSFRAKLGFERAKRQPEVGFSFSTEISKSDLYLVWLSRMSEKLGHHVNGAAREAKSGKVPVFDALAVRLADDCRNCRAPENEASLRNAVDDFIELVFGRCRRVMMKIESKVRAILNPAGAVDPVTAAYWAEYWKYIPQTCAQAGIAFDYGIWANDNKRYVVHRAVAADIEILFSLPFSCELFGGNPLIEKILAEMLPDPLAAAG